jgi:prepilin-type N-terminal cleavage/methylation domain-containing protein
MPRAGHQRGGFTLAELLVSMTLVALLGAAAMPFLVKQLRGVASTAGYLDAQQSVGNALDFVDHDLRLAGSGAGVNQPTMVEAATQAVTINADVVANDTTGEQTATYYDPSIPESLAVGMLASDPVTLPLTSSTYPESTYWASTGVVSNAETISFYIASDTSHGATANTYALWRRVNTGPVALLARNLDSSSKFQYYANKGYFNSADSAQLDSMIPASQLPLVFTYTGNAILTHADSLMANITQISVQLKSVYLDEFGHRHYRAVSEMIPVTNWGLSHLAACGTGPTGPASFSATVGSADTVVVTWTPPSGGEASNLVQNYIVYRKGPYTTSDPTFWSAILNVGASGLSSYTVKDPNLTGSGSKYDYAIATQNCTPSQSTLSTVVGVAPKP